MPVWPQDKAKLEIDPADDLKYAPSVDFSGGNNYRNSNISQPLPKNLTVIGHHYGAIQGEVGTVGLVREARLTSWLLGYAGGGIMFGYTEPSGPALLLGGEVKKKLARKLFLAGDISLSQGFRLSAEHERDKYFQSSLGLETRGWSFLYLREYFHHREEREWSQGPGVYRAIGFSGLYVGLAVFFPGHSATATVGFDPALRKE